jgi:hypothetical protein
VIALKSSAKSSFRVNSVNADCDEHKRVNNWENTFCKRRRLSIGGNSSCCLLAIDDGISLLIGGKSKNKYKHLTKVEVNEFEVMIDIKGAELEQTNRLSVESKSHPFLSDGDSSVGGISRNSTIACDAFSVVLLLARRRISVTISLDTICVNVVKSQNLSNIS